MLGMSRFALAADADLLLGFSDLLASMGAATVAAVASSNAAALRQVRTDQVKIGDLEDLERIARERDAEVLIGNSHAAHTAERLDIPLVRAGFLLYDQVGGYQRLWIGYQGVPAKPCSSSPISCCPWKGARSPPVGRACPGNQRR